VQSVYEEASYIYHFVELIMTDEGVVLLPTLIPVIIRKAIPERFPGEDSCAEI